MSSGFVTESELAEARRIRQAEWDQVRTDDQPLEAPEEQYDPRPLYQRLEEQKQKKDAEYEEAHKLKNMIRGLDDDEVGFLDMVEHTKATAQRQISLEEQRELREFRERVSSLQESAETRRLAQHLSPANTTTQPNNNSTRAKLQGVIVRKRKASDTPQDAPLATNGIKQNSTVEKSAKFDGNTLTTTEPSANNTSCDGSTTDNKTAKDGNTNGEIAFTGGMKCVAVLPGLGHYDDDTTDSENSSDSDECSPQKTNYDLCGRMNEKKKEDQSKS